VGLLFVVELNPILLHGSHQQLTRMKIVLCLVPYKRSNEQVSLQPCWCGVDGHSRYGAETFDAGNGLNCEGTKRKVELALVTINQPQLLAVCSNLESSPDTDNFFPQLDKR
jgi:hypothetical protein